MANCTLEDNLKNICEMQEIKNLELPELKQLSDDIRDMIINVVSANGGHLASSLGVVELAIALCRVFDMPKDKVVWDVGHQSYAYKILTDRKESFSTIRQSGGLSGFPKISESEFDCFGTGHSSTSISAAVGMAAARDLQGLDYNVAAVIGDAAISSGMAFEALNHAGHAGIKMIVILNDNGMSISANVGALSTYLSRMRSGQTYIKMKEDVKGMIKKVPAVGEKLALAVEKAKDSVKQFLVPGMLFEELGMAYYGPIDGHDITEICRVLENAKKAKGPVLIHLKTKKGKGFELAEKRPELFHGVAPFSSETGEKVAEPGHDNAPQISYSQIFGDAMVSMAETDDRIVAVSAAMSEGTGLSGFFSKFPKRSFDVGIAEEHAVTMAAGMAAAGMRPVVAVYSTFLQRAYDQIMHDVCLQGLPVVFAIDRAGLVGEDGPTHHGVFDISFLRHLPGIEVLAPSDGNELENMLAYALQQEGPVAIRYPRGKSRVESEIENVQPIVSGIMRCIASGDSGVTVLALGSMVAEVKKAIQLNSSLAGKVNIYDARFAKPINSATLADLAEKTKMFITVEENVRAGGFGSAVTEMLADQGYEGKIVNLGLGDSYVTHGPRQELLEICKLDAQSIADVIADAVEHVVLQPVGHEAKGFFNRFFAKWGF